jgi:hypothetical protein
MRFDQRCHVFLKVDGFARSRGNCDGEKPGDGENRGASAPK